MDLHFSNSSYVLEQLEHCEVAAPVHSLKDFNFQLIDASEALFDLTPAESRIDIKAYVYEISFDQIRNSWTCYWWQRLSSRLLEDQERRQRAEEGGVRLEYVVPVEYRCPFRIDLFTCAQHIGAES